MPDEIDVASDLTDLECELKVNAASQAVADMPVGEAGDCAGCPEYFERLVNGYCGRCRDRLRLP